MQFPLEKRRVPRTVHMYRMFAPVRHLHQALAFATSLCVHNLRPTAGEIDVIDTQHGVGRDIVERFKRPSALRNLTAKKQHSRT